MTGDRHARSDSTRSARVSSTTCGESTQKTTRGNACKLAIRANDRFGPIAPTEALLDRPVPPWTFHRRSLGPTRSRLGPTSEEILDPRVLSALRQRCATDLPVRVILRLTGQRDGKDGAPAEPGACSRHRASVQLD